MQESVVLVSADFFPESVNIQQGVIVVTDLQAHLNSLLGLDIYDEHSVQHWLGDVYKLILHVHC